MGPGISLLVIPATVMSYFLEQSQDTDLPLILCDSFLEDAGVVFGALWRDVIFVRG